MSGMSGANHEVTPQSPLEARTADPTLDFEGPEAQPGMAFKRISKSDCPLSLQWKRLPIDLGSEEPSCTRWSVRAPLSPSESVACAGYQPTLWSPSLMR